MNSLSVAETGPELLELERDSVSEVWTDCDDLREIERVINDTIQGIVLSKLSICIALARIKMNELYRQIGLETFKQYVLENRVNIHYNTALDYARIGEIVLKYRRELTDIDFRDEDGLKKLLLLDNALSENAEARDLLFGRLKESSYREYRRLVKQCLRPARAGRSGHAPCETMRSSLQLEIGEESITLLPIGKEIIWFDNDIWRYLGNPELPAKFKKHISRAIEDFFARYY